MTAPAPAPRRAVPGARVIVGILALIAAFVCAGVCVFQKAGSVHLHQWAGGGIAAAAFAVVCLCVAW